MEPAATWGRPSTEFRAGGPRNGSRGISTILKSCRPAVLCRLTALPHPTRARSFPICSHFRLIDRIGVSEEKLRNSKAVSRRREASKPDCSKRKTRTLSCGGSECRLPWQGAALRKRAGSGKWLRDSRARFWRRKRDSNPRTSHPVNGFQDRRLQPLGHSSIFKVANSWWIPQSEPDLRRIGLAKIDQGHCGSNFSISSATCFACKLAPSLLK